MGRIFDAGEVGKMKSISVTLRLLAKETEIAAFLVLETWPQGA